jgi:hypothetical protein
MTIECLESARNVIKEEEPGLYCQLPDTLPAESDAESSARVWRPSSPTLFSPTHALDENEIFIRGGLNGRAEWFHLGM